MWPGLIRPCDIFVDGNDIMYVPKLQGRVTLLTLETVVTRIGDPKSCRRGVFRHVVDEDVARLPTLGQTLSLYRGEGHLLVQQGVLGQVDPLLFSLAQKTLDLIAAIGEGVGLSG